MQTKEYTSKYMHIYIKHPQACIHVYKHRHIGFPQLQNHWWMKHYFQQSFVSRLNVSQHWYTDTPTSSPLCFLPTRTITMSIHNPTDTQTRTLVNRELICSYLPLSNWQSEAVQQEAINLHLHLHTARTRRAQCCHIQRTFQEFKYTCCQRHLCKHQQTRSRSQREFICKCKPTRTSWYLALFWRDLPV